MTSPSKSRFGRMARSCSAAGLVAVLVGACGSGLPTSSPVRQEAPVGNEVGGPVNVEFDGPSSGESPVDIVRGFLRAGGSTDGAYPVAHEFLDSATRGSWRPAASLAVNSGERNWDITQIASDKVRVTVTETAVLDASGHLRRWATPVRRTADFGIAQQSGQWRISTLPKDFGVWVAESDFTRAFAPRTVYYADRVTHTLVPDRQWVRGDAVATSLARAVLTPAPSWLAKLPLNKLPTDTQLQVDSVVVAASSGIASVALSREALDADTATRSALWAAMIATLTELNNVTSVELTVDGAPLDVGSGGQSPISPAQVGYSLTSVTEGPVIARTASGLSWQPADPETNDRMNRSSRLKVELPDDVSGVSQFAADGTGKQLCGVSADGRTLVRWVSGRRFVLPTFGTQLTRPTFAGRDELWVAGNTLGKGAGLWVIDTTEDVANAQPQAVPVSWLGSDRITDFRIADDSDRALLVVKRPNGASRLLLAAVVRDAHGNPASLGPPLDLSSGITDITSAVWADDANIVVLARSSDGVRQPIVVPVDGSIVTPLTAVADASALATTGQGTSGTYVITSTHHVLGKEGASWVARSGWLDVLVPGT